MKILMIVKHCCTVQGELDADEVHFLLADEKKLSLFDIAISPAKIFCSSSDDERLEPD
jgi:hypothetical protein